MILLNLSLICESFPLQDKLKSHPVQKPLLQLPAFGHPELRDAASSQKITHYSPALQAAGLTSHHHRRPALLSISEVLISTVCSDDSIRNILMFWLSLCLFVMI